MPRTSALAGLLILMGALSACTMWKEKQPPTWSSATGAEQFERLLWKEIQAANWAEVERHLAPTFVSVSPTAVEDRASFLEKLRRLVVTEYALGEMEIRPSGNDMVVTYTVTLSGSQDGQAISAQNWRVMTVWQQVGEEPTWTAIAHSHMPEGAKESDSSAPVSGQKQ